MAHEERVPVRGLPNAGKKRRLTTSRESFDGREESRTRLPTLKPAEPSGLNVSLRGRPPGIT